MRRETKLLPHVVVGLLLFLPTGCGVTTLSLTEPVLAKLQVQVLKWPWSKEKDETKDYRFGGEGHPTVVQFKQSFRKRAIRMILRDGTKLTGFMWIHMVNMDAVERLAEIKFGLTEKQIKMLNDGYAVTVVGNSAKQRPVYKIVLGIDRP